MSEEFVQVRLPEVPVRVWQRASAHHDAIKREFAIIMTDLPKNSAPHQLADLIAEFDDRFGGVGDPTWEDMYAAAERGDEEVTLVFEVPPEVADASARLLEMLDKVDAFCQEGDDLLSLSTPSDLVSFRKWFLGEFIRQIEKDLPPRSWSEWEEEEMSQPELDLKGGAMSADEVDGSRSVRFEGDLDLATAGALRDEIMNARNADARSVTVDLSGVGFMDSVGLSLLVTAHKRLKEDGAAMRLLLPEKLRRLFEISGLTEVLSPEFVGQAPRTAGTDEGS